MDMAPQKPLRQIGLHPGLVLKPLLLVIFQILLLLADLIFDRFYLYVDMHNVAFFLYCVGGLWFGLTVIRSATNKLLIFQDALEWRVGVWGQTQGTVSWAEVAEVKIMPTWFGRADNVLIKTQAGETLVFGPVLKSLQVKQFIDSLQAKTVSAASPTPPVL